MKCKMKYRYVYKYEIQQKMPRMESEYLKMKKKI